MWGTDILQVVLVEAADIIFEAAPNVGNGIGRTLFHAREAFTTVALGIDRDPPVGQSEKQPLWAHFDAGAACDAAIVDGRLKQGFIGTGPQPMGDGRFEKRGRADHINGNQKMGQRTQDDSFGKSFALVRFDESVQTQRQRLQNTEENGLVGWIFARKDRIRQKAAENGVHQRPHKPQNPAGPPEHQGQREQKHANHADPKFEAVAQGKPHDRHIRGVFPAAPQEIGNIFIVGGAPDTVKPGILAQFSSINPDGA